VTVAVRKASKAAFLQMSRTGSPYFSALAKPGMWRNWLSVADEVVQDVGRIHTEALVERG
jgi:hypothetical protein